MPGNPDILHSCRDQHAPVCSQFMAVRSPAQRAGRGGRQKLHPAGRQREGSVQVNRAQPEMRIADQHRNGSSLDGLFFRSRRADRTFRFRYGQRLPRM